VCLITQRLPRSRCSSMSPMTWSPHSAGSIRSSSQMQKRLTRGSCGFEADVEPGGHAAERLERCLKLAAAGGRGGGGARAAGAALGRWIADAGGDEAFLLEAGEGLVDRAERQLAADAAFDLVMDGHAVRVAARVEDAEDDELFELTEHAVGRFDRQCLGY